MRFSSSTAAGRVVDVILDCLIVLVAFIGVMLALGGSAWAPLWVVLSVLGAAGQFVQTALERAEEWSPFGRSLPSRGGRRGRDGGLFGSRRTRSIPSARSGAGRGDTGRFDSR